MGTPPFSIHRVHRNSASQRALNPVRPLQVPHACVKVSYAAVVASQANMSGEPRHTISYYSGRYEKYTFRFGLILALKKQLETKKYISRLAPSVEYYCGLRNSKRVRHRDDTQQATQRLV